MRNSVARILLLTTFAASLISCTPGQNPDPDSPFCVWISAEIPAFASFFACDPTLITNNPISNPPASASPYIYPSASAAPDSNPSVSASPYIYPSASAAPDSNPSASPAPAFAGNPSPSPAPGGSPSNPSVIAQVCAWLASVNPSLASSLGCGAVAPISPNDAPSPTGNPQPSIAPEGVNPPASTAPEGGATPSSAPSAAPVSAGCPSPTATALPSGSPITINALNVYFYSLTFQQNNQNCYPTPQSTPGGTGSVNDPITAMADAAQIPPGTYIYIPGLGREFIVQDMCTSTVSGTDGLPQACTGQTPPMIGIYVPSLTAIDEGDASGVTSTPQVDACIKNLSLNTTWSGVQMSASPIVGATFPLPTINFDFANPNGQDPIPPVASTFGTPWLFYDQILYVANTPTDCWQSNGATPGGAAALPQGASVTCPPDPTSPNDDSAILGIPAGKQIYICTGLLPGDGSICHVYAAPSNPPNAASPGPTYTTEQNGSGFPSGAKAYCYLSTQAQGTFSGQNGGAPGTIVPPGCSETDAQGALTQGIICFDGQNQAGSYDYYPGAGWTCYATPSTPVDPSSGDNVPGVWCTTSGAWQLTTGQTVKFLPAGCARPEPKWDVPADDMVCFQAISGLINGGTATGVVGTIAAGVGEQYPVEVNAPPVLFQSPSSASPPAPGPSPSSCPAGETSVQQFDGSFLCE